MNAVIPYFANPGSKVTIVAQVTDGYTGALSDGYVPTVEKILFPTFEVAAGFPQPMVKLDTGLYVFSLTIPSGSAYLGTFLVQVFWAEPGTGKQVWQTFAINVVRPFGNTTATPV
jgi:hypothetical protein